MTRKKFHDIIISNGTDREKGKTPSSANDEAEYLKTLHLDGARLLLWYDTIILLRAGFVKMELKISGQEPQTGAMLYLGAYFRGSTSHMGGFPFCVAGIHEGSKSE